jgi:hypothetical protein
MLTLELLQEFWPQGDAQVRGLIEKMAQMRRRDFRASGSIMT